MGRSLGQNNYYVTIGTFKFNLFNNHVKNININKTDLLNWLSIFFLNSNHRFCINGKR